MTAELAEVPLFIAIIVALFLIIGSGLTLLGTLGLARLSSFYERIHAPTLATSWGTGGIVFASIILFSSITARPVFHELLIGAFVTLTTPITLMTLGRAAVYRDRSESNQRVPDALGTAELEEAKAKEQNEADGLDQTNEQDKT